jgi:hypothetical protein
MNEIQFANVKIVPQEHAPNVVGLLTQDRNAWRDRAEKAERKLNGIPSIIAKALGENHNNRLSQWLRRG